MHQFSRQHFSVAFDWVRVLSESSQQYRIASDYPNIHFAAGILSEVVEPIKSYHNITRVNILGLVLYHWSVTDNFYRSRVCHFALFIFVTIV
jgi:hypothetical protein